MEVGNWRIEQEGSFSEVRRQRSEVRKRGKRRPKTNDFPVEIISDAAKNLWRRKLRSLMAVLGVAAGIFSFLVMGSMAEHFHRIGREFNNRFINRIFVCEKPTFWAGGGILSQAKVEKVEKVPGVAEVIPMLIFRMRLNQLIMVGIPRVVIGIPPEKVRTVLGDFPLLKGKRKLTGKKEAILGFDIAREMDLKINDSITIEKHRFRVVGIFQKSGGLIDRQVYIPLEHAQSAYHRQGLVTSMSVIPAENADPEELALRIKNNVRGVEVIPPSRFRQQVQSSLSLWNALTLGAALAAGVAGALCVIIVMLVAVSERVVEIGIKKAIGATQRYIVLEFLAESILISVSGWVVGSILTLAFTWLAGSWVRQLGSDLFELTFQLFAFALFGSIILGSIFGAYPAYRASRVNPMEALKIRY